MDRLGPYRINLVRCATRGHIGSILGLYWAPSGPKTFLTNQNILYFQSVQFVDQAKDFSEPQHILHRPRKMFHDPRTSFHTRNIFSHLENCPLHLFTSDDPNQGLDEFGGNCKREVFFRSTWAHFGRTWPTSDAHAPSWVHFK